MAFLVERADTVSPVFPLPLGPGTDVSAGHALATGWAAVPGADGVEVTDCRLTITPGAFERTRPDLPTATDGNARVVTLPDGEYLTALTLAGLARVDGGTTTAVRGTGDLGPRRLTVALSPDTTTPFGPPVYAVPSVPGSGQLPSTLTGAWLEPGPAPTVRFTRRVRARRVRVALATGDDFAAQPMALGAVSARTETLPTDLTVTGPDGAVVWSSAGESVPDVPAEVDLTVPARLALTAALTAPGAVGPAAAKAVPAGAAPVGPGVTFTVGGGAGSHVRLEFTAATGALTRTFAGVRETSLDGEPAAAAGITDLPAVVPSTVTGDLTVSYLGLRLHPDLSDPVPAPGAALAGPVVRADGPPVPRALPPGGPGPLPLARVGVYGVPDPDDAELAAAFVRPDGTALTPGQLTERRLQPARPDDRHARLVWFDVPPEVARAVAEEPGPVALRLHATRGRFLWAEHDGRPVARFVVADPDPEPRPVRINGLPLASVDGHGVHATAAALPAAAFVTPEPGTGPAGPGTAPGPGAGQGSGPGTGPGGAPVLDSDLFVRVALSDVVLRYPR